MIGRVAVAGFGAVAENAHLPALREAGVEVAAVFDPSPQRRAAAAALLPRARLHDSLAALLARERALDALIVASPPKFHAEAALAGLRAGLHVLCEKPLTLDPEAWRELRAAADDARRCLYTVDNWAHAPALARLIALAGSGRLGRVRRVELEVLRTRPCASALPDDWRKNPAISGGGILVDHGWHNLYLACRLLGATPRLERASLEREGGVDVAAELALRADCGARATIRLTWKAAARANRVLVEGDGGRAELDDDALIVDAGMERQTQRFPEKLSAGSAHPAWLAAMWPSFAAECRGEDRGRNLEEAAFCLEVIAKAYRTPETARA